VNPANHRLTESGGSLMSAEAREALLSDLLHVFVPQFAPTARVLHVSDQSERATALGALMAVLGADCRSLARLPSAVLHVEATRRTFLIDVISPLGPIDTPRRVELSHAFSTRKADLLFVTAFPNRLQMVPHVADIAWKTEVWCADSPSHLIHFNGDRFLGPH
jgi:adenine-specific DNA-methyltransferase